MIERLSTTAFRLSGLPTGMMQNIDDEAYYGHPSRAEQVSDKWRAFLTQQGRDTYIDQAGELQPWYPGMGYPEPLRRLTPDERPGLERAFFHLRIAHAVAASPEGQWLIRENLWQYEAVLTYSPNGSLVVELGSQAHGDRFAEAFNSATA